MLPGWPQSATQMATGGSLASTGLGGAGGCTVQPGFASFLQAGVLSWAEGAQLLLVIMTWQGCRGWLLTEPG